MVTNRFGPMSAIPLSTKENWSWEMSNHLLGGCTLVSGRKREHNPVACSTGEASDLMTLQECGCRGEGSPSPVSAGATPPKPGEAEVPPNIEGC